MGKRITVVLVLATILGFVSISTAQAEQVIDSFSRVDDTTNLLDSLGNTEVPFAYDWSESQFVFDDNLNAADIPGGYMRLFQEDRLVTLDTDFQEVPDFSTDVVFNVVAGGAFPRGNATVFLRKGGVLSGAFVWTENDGKIAIQFDPSGRLTVYELNGGALDTLYDQNPWTTAVSSNFGAPGSLPATVNGVPFDVDQDGRISAAASFETVTLGASLVGNSLDVSINGLSITGPLALTFDGSSTGNNYIALGSNALGFLGTSVVTNFLEVEINSLPGDFVGDFPGDLDGNVNGADFLAWQRGESSNPLSSLDLARWEANFGTVGGLSASTAPLAASAVVPEPTSILLAGVCLVGLLGFARRKRCSAGLKEVNALVKR